MKQSTILRFVKPSEIRVFDFLKSISFGKLKFFDEDLIFPFYGVKKEGEIFIVDGHKRLERVSTKREIPILLTPYTSKIDCFLLYFKINLVRGFNSVEFSNILATFTDELIRRYVFEKTDKKFSQDNLKNYLGLQKLIDPLKMELSEERLNFNVGVRIADLPEEFQKDFFIILKNLRLNHNKQRRFFENVYDYAVRMDIPFEKVIKVEFEEFIKAEFYSKDLEDRFFDKLTRIYAPDFYSYHKAIMERKEEALKGVGGVNIYSPDNYESGVLKAEIFFKSTDELKRKLKALERFRFP